jgi:succinyl-diaminopimelate desuccinylase
MYREKYAALLNHISEKEIVELTRRLIQFKSVNPPGDELEAARFVGELLREEGLEVEVLEHTPSRGSVVAKVLGKAQAPGLMFSGHLDVVPVEGNWKCDPFEGEVAEGKIWGRGSTDMKGGVAAMIVAALTLIRAGLDLRGDLYLCFTAGEESDNFGAAETLKAYPFGPVRAVLIAEPSDNEVYTAEKGALWLEITTYGKAAHISRMEEGRNALMMMLPILHELDKIEIPFEHHPLLGDYRRSINTIHAGTKINTIPSKCVTTVDQRTLPGQDHSKIMSKVEELVEKVSRKSRLPDFKTKVRAILDNPPLEVSPDEPALKPLFAITAEINGRDQDIPKGVGFFTDAVKLAPALKAPFAICGPGNPKLNHQTNEWVDIDKLVDSVRIFAIAAAELLA